VNGPGGRKAAMDGVSVEKMLKVPKDAGAVDVVDAAIAKFLQRPLQAEKKKALVEAIGEGPVRLGSRDDRRVLQMIGLLMSTPEYQMQ